MADEVAVKQWTPKQRIFQTWLANPFDRDPATQRELAEILKVHELTLTAWKRKPGWDDAVSKIAQGLVVGEVPGLIQAAVVHARAGNYQYWAALMRMANVKIDGEPQVDGRTQIALVFNDGRDASVITLDATRGSIESTEQPSEIQRRIMWSPVGENGNGANPHNGSGHK